MAAGGSPRQRAGCRVPGAVMVRVLSRGLPLRVDPQVSPWARVGVLSLSPSWGQRGIRGVARTRCHPSPSFLCPSVLSSSPSSLSSLSPCPALSCVHGQEGPCQRGPASVSWQRQRLAAPAASTVSPGFLCGAEGRAGQPHTDWPMAGFGEERPWGAASLLSFPPLPLGVSLNFHGSFLPKPSMCLDVSWRKHGGARGRAADSRCAPGRRPGAGLPGFCPLVCGGGRPCMDPGLAAFLHCRSVCALAFEDAVDACPPLGD